MPPRLLLATLAASSLALLLLAAPACWTDNGYGGSNCPPGLPKECCPCPIIEACSDYYGYYHPKPIPWECPNACDGPEPRPPRCSDAGADGGEDGGMSSLCPSGTCRPKSPQAWTGPVKLWSGPAIDAPACPAEAPTLVFDGQPEPEPPPCGSCSCDAPVGSCKLPASWTVTAAAFCGLGVNTNFGPRANWDGSCTANNPIVAGQLCGGIPCVQSVLIEPPTVEEAPCVAHDGADPVPPPPRVVAGEGFYAEFGRACTSASWPACGENVCMPDLPGFETCVYRNGDEPCPEGWPEKHLLYGQVEDGRTCTACTCSAPSGGNCAVDVRLFGDDACTQQLAAATLSSSDAPGCADPMDGASLIAKSANVLVYQPGTCTPEGGMAEGPLVLDDPKTFCCLGSSVS